MTSTFTCTCNAALGTHFWPGIGDRIFKIRPLLPLGSFVVFSGQLGANVKQAATNIAYIRELMTFSIAKALTNTLICSSFKVEQIFLYDKSMPSLRHAFI